MMNETAAMGRVRFIRCNIGDEAYGLDMRWVRSIQRADQMKTAAESRDLVGWLPAQNGDIPVYNLASRLDRTTATPARYGRVVVLNPVTTLSNRPWALLVDRVSQVVEIASAQLVQLPALVTCSPANYFRGAIRLGEELVLLLAPEQAHPDASPRARQAANAIPRSTAEFKNHAPSVSPIMSDAQKQARQDKQILLFSTSDPAPGERVLSFALSITQVPEILTTARPTRVPGAPPFVLGLIDWRNRLVPVIDLNARLGLPSTGAVQNERSRLLIVRAAAEAQADVFAGLVIRPTIRALRLPVAYESCHASPVIEKRWVSGIVDLEKETVVIPDLAQVLRFEELQNPA